MVSCSSSLAKKFLMKLSMLANAVSESSLKQSFLNMYRRPESASKRLQASIRL